ncbi:Pseudomurein-binding repeat-containing protein [Methanobacterium lacus]|uniref:Pseudomurein-binding repeat-containing protein n=1 Tax=Methanobacterium lacus (strain AL-21) TaxID=877455 RepID=F0TC25_METLA|nr:pseudomurein-binding repeat-containing protein [Methanobacterium lacus]ADZ09176.1 Pseudomurein-binding repeat-containing protein [Methanobacterium lacus]
MINKKMVSVLIGLLMIVSIGASAATSTTGNYSVSQIGQSSGNVKNYVETQNSLPSKVSVGNKNVTTAQFLYLMTSATSNLAKNNKNSIYFKNVSNPTSPSETFKGGTIDKNTYLSMASSVNSYIAKYGKAPNYVTTAQGTIKYQSMVYMYSKIMNYYKINNKLPTSVTLKSWYAQTLGPAATVNATSGFFKTSAVLGSTSYGKVLRLSPIGTGTNKVAIIIGVHPLEVQTHIAMLNAIYAMSKSLKNVQITIFDVIVYNGDNYDTGRSQGQTLASKYVVPNIGTSYKLVMDVHGNTGRGEEVYSGYPNFVFAPLQDSKSNSYASKIASSQYTTGLINHYVKGTSPIYVTIPIAKKGIPTIVYEQYVNQANYAKVMYLHAVEVLKSINSIFA